MPRPLLLLLALAACSSDGATMIVENRSQSLVTDVLISVRAAQYKIAELKPGEVEAFSAQPRGESDVSVSYKVAGRVVEVRNQGYFEGSPDYVVVVGLMDSGANVVTTIKGRSPE